MAPDEDSQPLYEVGVFPMADADRCELESRVTSSPPIALWHCGQVLDDGSSSAAHVGQEGTLARTAILAELSGILPRAPLMPGVTTAEIPNRSLFRQPE